MRILDTRGVRVSALTGGVALALSLAACGGTEEATNNGGDAEEPVTLKFGYFIDEGHPMAQLGLIPFAEEVEERSGGSITFDMYPNGQLGAGAEALDALENDVMDLTFVVAAYFPEELPLNQAWAQPFSASTVELTNAMWRTMHGENVLAEEIREQNIVPLMTWATPSYQFQTTDQPLPGFGATEGQRMRTPGEAFRPVLTAVGVEPVVIPSDEQYQALDRGTIDGAFADFSVWDAFSLNEVLNHSTVGLATATGSFDTLAISTEDWESLSGEQQTVLAEASKNASMAVTTGLDDLSAETASKFEEAGEVELYEWSDADVAKLAQAFEPLPDAWADSAEGGGLNGEDAVATIRENLEEARNLGPEDLPDFELENW